MNSLIKVVSSDEFKAKIKEALNDSHYENWGYDGENEYPYDEFDEDMATENIIEVFLKVIKNNTSE